MLILKRNPDARYTESYNVLFEGRYVGRIYKVLGPQSVEAYIFPITSSSTGTLGIMGNDTSSLPAGLPNGTFIDSASFTPSSASPVNLTPNWSLAPPVHTG